MTFVAALICLFLSFVLLAECKGGGKGGKGGGKRKKKGTQFEKWPLPAGSCPVGSQMDSAGECCILMIFKRLFLYVVG